MNLRAKLPSPLDWIRLEFKQIEKECIMRRLWIDTDTASDDAVAILMALRHCKALDICGMVRWL